MALPPTTGKKTLQPGRYQVRAGINASVSIASAFFSNVNIKSDAISNLRVTIQDLVGTLTVRPQVLDPADPVSISLKNSGGFPADMSVLSLTVTRPGGAVDTFAASQLPGAVGGPPRIPGGLAFQANYPAGFPAGANTNAPGIYRVRLSFDDEMEEEFEVCATSNTMGTSNCDLVGGVAELPDGSDAPAARTDGGASRGFDSPAAFAGAAVALALAVAVGGWFARRRLPL